MATINTRCEARIITPACIVVNLLFIIIIRVTSISTSLAPKYVCPFHDSRSIKVWYRECLTTCGTIKGANDSPMVILEDSLSGVEIRGVKIRTYKRTKTSIEHIFFRCEKIVKDVELPDIKIPGHITDQLWNLDVAEKEFDLVAQPPCKMSDPENTGLFIKASSVVFRVHHDSDGNIVVTDPVTGLSGKGSRGSVNSGNLRMMWNADHLKDACKYRAIDHRLCVMTKNGNDTFIECGGFKNAKITREEQACGMTVYKTEYGTLFAHSDKHKPLAHEPSGSLAAQLSPIVRSIAQLELSVCSYMCNAVDNYVDMDLSGGHIVQTPIGDYLVLKVANGSTHLTKCDKVPWIEILTPIEVCGQGPLIRIKYRMADKTAPPEQYWWDITKPYLVENQRCNILATTSAVKPNGEIDTWLGTITINENGDFDFVENVDSVTHKNEILALHDITTDNHEVKAIGHALLASSKIAINDMVEYSHTESGVVSIIRRKVEGATEAVGSWLKSMGLGVKSIVIKIVMWVVIIAILLGCMWLVGKLLYTYVKSRLNKRRVVIQSEKKAGEYDKDDVRPPPHDDGFNEWIKQYTRLKLK